MGYFGRPSNVLDDSAGAKRALFTGLLIASILLMFHLEMSQFPHFYAHPIGENMAVIPTREKILYASYSVNTPDGKSFGEYNDVFYLPLTALAWERIGFKSVIVITGYRNQWEKDPLLNLVLEKLEERKATVIFIESIKKNVDIISQTARIFTANLNDFPGSPDDYLITTGSDLWPLRQEHFIPRSAKDLILVRPDCCRTFHQGKEEYQAINIGTKVSTWKQILNENRSILPKDALSILSCLKEDFGTKFNKLNKDSEKRWLDQLFISKRLNEWIAKYGKESVYQVLDEGFYGLDHLKKDSEEVPNNPTDDLNVIYEAHMPSKLFFPSTWKEDENKNLIQFMYGKGSELSQWCDDYVTTFYSKVKNYVTASTSKFP